MVFTLFKKTFPGFQTNYVKIGYKNTLLDAECKQAFLCLTKAKLNIYLNNMVRKIRIQCFSRSNIL